MKNLGRKACMNAYLAFCCMVQQEQMCFYCFSRMSANNANVENLQAGNNWQAPPVLPVPPVPPVPPLNPNSIIASVQGGSFSLQSAEQYVMLSEEQKKMLLPSFLRRCCKIWQIGQVKR